MDPVLVKSSLDLAWFQISPLVTNLLMALLLILVGCLVAKGLGMLTTLVFTTLQLDKGAEKVSLHKLLEKGEVKRSVSELLGDMVYWLTVFVVIAGIAGIFGLAVEPMLSRVFTYMGAVLLAAILLGLGLFLATLISGIVRLVTVNLGLQGAKTASRLMYYIVIIFTFITVLAELGINPEVFVPQIGVIIGAFGLAAAIAFGLGCKDMAADFLSNLFRGK
jgi:small-conductance mechanosensitive channel